MPGRLKRHGLALAVIVGVAILVAAVFGPWYLNYDARYALLWARDLREGATPDFLADFAPTPHPLSNAWSLIGSDTAMVWLALLAFGLVVWLTFRLGTELFGHWAVGAVAALVVLTRPVLLRDAVLAYQDVPFACFVLGAVLVEARRPRNGYRTLGLLVGAGLLRPEAWLLGGLYWLHVTWPAALAVRSASRSEGRRPRAKRSKDDSERPAEAAGPCPDEPAAEEAAGPSWQQIVLLGGLVWLAPAIWVLMDLAVTGDPLHSLNGTSALAEAADRRRTFGEVPKWTAYYFGNVLREPGLLGVALGLGVAWWLKLRRAWLPLAIVIAMVVVFAINPAFGLPLIGRYVRTPSILLALFYGLAVAAWLTVPKDDPRRRRLQAIAAVAVLGTAVYLPWHYREISAVETRVDRTTPFYEGLRDIGRDQRVRQVVQACGGTLTAADYRPIPYLRWWLETGPDTITTVAQDESPLQRVLLVPRRTRAPRYVYKENFPRDVQPPSDWKRVAQNASWRVFADPSCSG